MRPPPRTRFAAIFVGFVLLVYGATFSGQIVSNDNLAQFLQTLQIVDHHRVSFTAAEVAGLIARADPDLATRFTPNVDGRSFSIIYGPAQALMAAPVFIALRAGRQLIGATRPADVTLWCANWPLFAAATVAVLASICGTVLPGRRAWQWLLIGSAAFASPVWMFSSLPYNVVGELLGTAVAIRVCLTASATPGSGRTRNAVALGASLIAIAAVRPFAFTAWPAFIWWYVAATGGAAALRDPTRRRDAIAVGTTLAAGAALLLAFNAAHFGSPFRTGYSGLGAAINFDGPWLPAFLDTFLSPLMSPIYFFPLSVLAPIAIVVLLWRGEHAVAIFALLFLAPHVYLMPKYSFWAAGPDLFLRFWLRTVPVVFVLAATVVAQVRLPRCTDALALAIVAVLTVLGFRAQLLTSLTNERTVYAELAAGYRAAAGRGVSEPEQHVRAGAGDLLVGHTDVARQQFADLHKPRVFLLWRDVDVPVRRLWMVLALVGAALVALWRAIDQPNGSSSALT